MTSTTQKTPRFDRTRATLFSRWWWTVDRLMLFMLIGLMLFGALLVTAASPPVAARIGEDAFHFVTKQHFFLALSFILLLTTSLFPPNQLRRIAVLGFLGSILIMLALPVIGYENKGAIRWFRFLGMSLQPSELMKPCFAVVVAWVFAERQKIVGFPGFKIGIGIYLFTALLLLMQPDFGMTVTLSGMFAAQLVMAGVAFGWIALMVVGGISLLLGAYHFMPHVRGRIDRFLDPSSGDNYQVTKSMQAFENGGLLGTGPGEGVVKWSIPDSHTDYVFAVVGEEFGLLVALAVILLYASIVLRGFWRIWHERDPFISLACTGLLVMFGLQAVINMGVSVNLLPSKGMTLPFLSYGGSSLFGMAIGMGMVLALTRRQYGTMHQSLTRFGTRSS
jgi:cell division protein FtsW